jgi:hypothetical protein
MSDIAELITSIGIREGDDLHVGSLRRLGITREDLEEAATEIGAEMITQISGLDYYVLRGVS